MWSPCKQFTSNSRLFAEDPLGWRKAGHSRLSIQLMIACLTPSAPDSERSCGKTSMAFLKIWCRLSTTDSRVWASPGATSWMMSCWVVHSLNWSLHHPRPSSVQSRSGSPKCRTQHLSRAWMRWSDLSPSTKAATWYFVAMSTIERIGIFLLSTLIHMTSAWTVAPNWVCCWELEGDGLFGLWYRRHATQRYSLAASNTAVLAPRDSNMS